MESTGSNAGVEPLDGVPSDETMLFQSFVTTRNRRLITAPMGFEGRVGIIDGCFAINGMLVIFPKGSAEIVEGGRSLRYDDTRYSVGDIADLTGSGVPLRLVPDVIVPPQVQPGRSYFLAAGYLLPKSKRPKGTGRYSDR